MVLLVTRLHWTDEFQVLGGELQGSDWVWCARDVTDRDKCALEAQNIKVGQELAYLDDEYVSARATKLRT